MKMVSHSVNGAPKGRVRVGVAAGLQPRLVKVKIILEQGAKVQKGTRGIVLQVL
jgi:hypothetical protein